jgi:hypothetical protein
MGYVGLTTYTLGWLGIELCNFFLLLSKRLSHSHNMDCVRYVFRYIYKIVMRYVFITLACIFFLQVFFFIVLSFSIELVWELYYIIFLILFSIRLLHSHNFGSQGLVGLPLDLLTFFVSFLLIIFFILSFYIEFIENWISYFFQFIFYNVIHISRIRFISLTY